MKSKTSFKPGRWRALLKVLVAAVATILIPSITLGQIFVAGAGSVGGFGAIGKYNLDGTTVNAAIISSGLANPKGIAVSGGNLFVANYSFPPGFGIPIGKYTTSGATVTQSLTSNLIFANKIAVSGNDLYVTEAASVDKFTTSGAVVKDPFFGPLTSLAQGITVSDDGARLFVIGIGDIPIGTKNGTVGVYDAITGAAINANFITGLDHPTGIALFGDKLYVANAGNGTIGKYNLDGTPVNPSFITGLGNPLDLAAFGGNLYVVNNGTNSVGEYDAATGAAINAALITGLNDPQGIAIVPEPASAALLLAGAIGLVGLRSCFRRR